MKISKLTKEQTDLFPQYVDKWLKLGLCTERIDRQAGISQIHDLQRLIQRPVTPVVFLDGPLHAWLAACLFYPPNVTFESQAKPHFWYQIAAWVGSEARSQVESQVESQIVTEVWSQVRSQVRSQVGSQVESQVELQVQSQIVTQVDSQFDSQAQSQIWSQVQSQVRSQIWSQVDSQVHSQVGSQVQSQVWAQVWSQVWSQVESQVVTEVWSQVRSQVESQVRSQVVTQVWSHVLSHVRSYHPPFVWPYLDGHLWASWCSYYDFLSRFVPLPPQFYTFKKIVHFGNIYPLDNICIVSEKPTEIRMRSGLLHNESGPSIEYADGTKVYSLNGVRMFPEHITTTLTPQQILLVENAQQRRELIRKMGIERMLVALPHKILETVGNYSLLSVDLDPTIKNARYLKMLNPSIGTWHVEGVDPTCSTVEQAINWRANETETWKPEILT